MVRQFWIFLLDDDEPAFFDAIRAASKGAVVAQGRFVKQGDPQALLRGDASTLEFAQLSEREVQRLVFDAQASKRLVAHPVTEGPLAGAQAIDVSFSECLHLVRPRPNRGMLEPAKLFGETHVQRGEKKLRKSPEFTLWLSAVHKRLKAEFPKSAVDFIHVGPRARAWAESGQGKLTYLYQPIGLSPVAPPTEMTTPQKKR